MNKRISKKKLKNKRMLKEKNSIKKLNRILVISTMSAGKSTLINALIGQDLFPSRNCACTEKVIKYVSDNSLKSVKAIVQGRNERKFNNITSKEIEEFNDSKDYHSLKLIGPIRSLYEYKNLIEIIDTPGTNNSQNGEHMKVTLEFLQLGEFDMILYLLNATQLGVNDDLILLTNIKQYLDKNSNKRIVFVLNKMDQIDDELESIDEIYNNTIKYINKCGIDEVNIVSLSAESAKLIKKEKYDILTHNEERKLKMYKAMFGEVNYKLYNYQNLVKNLDKIRLKDKKINKNLLMKSGLAVLEKYLANI